MMSSERVAEASAEMTMGTAGQASAVASAALAPNEPKTNSVSMACSAPQSRTLGPHLGRGSISPGEDEARSLWQVQRNVDGQRP
jgi:hypothetical protein